MRANHEATSPATNQFYQAVNTAIITQIQTVINTHQQQNKSYKLTYYDDALTQLVKEIKGLTGEPDQQFKQLNALLNNARITAAKQKQGVRYWWTYENYAVDQALENIGLEQCVAIAQNRIVSLETQNQEIIKNKNDEIQVLQTKITELQQKDTEINGLKKQLEQAQAHNQQLKNINEQYDKILTSTQSILTKMGERDPDTVEFQEKALKLLAKREQDGVQVSKKTNKKLELSISRPQKKPANLGSKTTEAPKEQEPNEKNKTVNTNNNAVTKVNVLPGSQSADYIRYKTIKLPKAFGDYFPLIEKVIDYINTNESKKNTNLIFEKNHQEHISRVNNGLFQFIENFIDDKIGDELLKPFMQNVPDAQTTKSKKEEVKLSQDFMFLARFFDENLSALKQIKRMPVSLEDLASIARALYPKTKDDPKPTLGRVLPLNEALAQLCIKRHAQLEQLNNQSNSKANNI